MECPQFTAWITKYALSTGISEEVVEGCFEINEEMVKVVGGTFASCFHGKDWHRTRNAALQRAEAMRLGKIAALQKQIAKLEKLRFS